MYQKIAKLLLCSMAITLLLTGCGCSNSKDKNKDKAKPSATPPPNGTILGDQKVGELEITDFSVANKDGMSNLVANVKNKKQGVFL